MLRRIHVRNPSVRVFGGAAHRRFGASGDIDRRARFLDRQRFEAEILQRGVSAFVGDIGLGPDACEDLQRIIGPRAALPDRHTTGLEFGRKFTADTNPHRVSAARSDIERGAKLRQ